MCPVANCITTVCILIFLPLFLYAHEYDPSPGYAPTIKFEHLSVDQGLSYNSVLDIIQDDQGFMWFATEDGLNKYDGYKVTVYKNIKNVSSSLSNNFVYDIHKDHSGILWIATAFGLNKYDRAHDNFVRYFDTLPDAGDVGSNSICDISNPDPLNDEILWLGTGYGLCEFHITSGQYDRYQLSAETGQKPPLFGIRDINNGRHYC